jgi:hypothetical protein
MAALEATAKWIQSQPLDLSSDAKGKTKQVNVCTMCQQTLETQSCPNCHKPQSRITKENGIPKDMSWSLHADRHHHGETVSAVSTALNCTKDTVVVPIYQGTECNHDDKQNWKSKFHKGTNNVDANLNKYPNVEYQNLHLDSPEAENKDKPIDKNCTKVDMSQLLGQSYECVQGFDKTASTEGGKIGGTAKLLPLDSVSKNILKDPESKSRHQLSPHKSDSCLHPPVQHNTRPVFPGACKSPSSHFLSPRNSPNSTPHTSPRPNRSTLSLNLPHTLTTEVFKSTLKSRYSPGDYRQNNTTIAPSGGCSSNHSSTQSLPKIFLQNKSVDSGKAQSTQSISMTTITGTDSGCNLDTLENGKQTSL